MDSVHATEPRQSTAATDSSTQLAIVNDAIEALDEGVSLWDADLNFVLSNDRYLQISFPDGAALPQQGENAREILLRMVTSGHVQTPLETDPNTVVEGILTWIKAFGPPQDFHLNDSRIIEGRPCRTKLGGYMITLRDVTSARNAEAERIAAVNDAVGALQEGFALVDPTFNIVLCNAQFSALALPTGLPPIKPGTAIREVLHQVYYSDAVALGTETFDDFLDSSIAWMKEMRGPREYRFRDGRVTRTRVSKTALGGYLILISDVTGERNTEEQARDMLLDAFQSLDEGLVLCDDQMRFVFANDAWHKMMFDRPDRVPPQPGQNAMENLAAQVRSGYYDIPDGMSDEDYIAWMMGEMAQHGKQVPFRAADGRHFIGSSHLTSYGGSLMFIRDVTEQTRTEEALAEQREIAHRTEKLSALGELLAGVAHELNNPLSVVFGYSQMLQGKVSDPILAERIDLIRQSAERAAKIVKTFLAMARQRPTKVQTCSINEIAQTALEVSSYSLKTNGTRVQTELDPTEPAINGDFDQLAQVFSNLIINAGQAVAPQRDRGQILVRSFVDTAAGETVVEVRDNGPGIPDAIQNRIFEPFFTTKDVGEGTGVGLAFSHRIVQSHEGKLDLRSAPQSGTSFFVRLASVTQPAKTECDGPDPHATPLPALRVLVIDDEEGVVHLIASLLAEEGFAVTTTTSSREALYMIERQGFDVVLSDFKMPDMDGQAFFEAAQTVSPQTAQRIGFITGDAMSARVRDFFDTTGRPYIEKPIIKSELLALLARVGLTKETRR